MDKHHALIKILFDADISTRSYSGRGMFGRECLGVETGDVGNLIAEIILGTDDDTREDVAEAFQSMRTDSMGRGTIVYFPKVAFADLNEEDEEKGFPKNAEGLTFERWVMATGRESGSNAPALVEAWKAGEDPAEHRVG